MKGIPQRGEGRLPRASIRPNKRNLDEFVRKNAVVETRSTSAAPNAAIHDCHNRLLSRRPIRTPPLFKYSHIMSRPSSSSSAL